MDARCDPHLHSTRGYGTTPAFKCPWVVDSSRSSSVRMHTRGAVPEPHVDRFCIDCAKPLANRVGPPNPFRCVGCRGGRATYLCALLAWKPHTINHSAPLQIRTEHVIADWRSRCLRFCNVRLGASKSRLPGPGAPATPAIFVVNVCQHSPVPRCP